MNFLGLRVNQISKNRNSYAAQKARETLSSWNGLCQGVNLFQFYCHKELPSKEIFSLIPALVLCTLNCLKHVSSSEWNRKSIWDYSANEIRCHINWLFHQNSTCYLRDHSEEMAETWHWLGEETSVLHSEPSWRLVRKRDSGVWEMEVCLFRMLNLW